jgi:hypothetical protein
LEFTLTECVSDAWVELVLEFVVVADADQPDLRFLEITLGTGAWEFVEEIVTIPDSINLVKDDENGAAECIEFLVELCQRPTAEAVGLSVDSRSADTGVSDATSVALTVMIPDFRAY